VGDDFRIRRSQNLLQNERRVRRIVVVKLGPGVAAPLLWKFVLDFFTSIDSELRNRILYSPSVLVEEIFYARCFQYKTFVTFSVVVLFEGLQERFSSSTDIRLFMKGLNHP
jgi:hypothetical protein